MQNFRSIVILSVGFVVGVVAPHNACAQSANSALVRRVTAKADRFIGLLMQQPERSPWMDVDDEGGVARAIGPLVIVRQAISKHARIAALLSGK